MLIFASAGAASAAGVTDGDTVTIGADRIRIANIDTPEIHHAQCDAERRLGLVAKSRMIVLLGSGTVVVHPGDPGTGRLRDRYGRMLATITVDGRDVGDIMIAEGIARPWEGGASTRQLMKTLGHDDMEHAELYSREAEQVLMATEGMDRVVNLMGRRKARG